MICLLFVAEPLPEPMCLIINKTLGASLGDILLETHKRKHI